MALYGPNGDAAFLATAKENGQRQGSWSWLGWFVSIALLVIGVVGRAPVLIAVGAVGIVAMTVWFIPHWRRTRRWRHLSATNSVDQQRPTARAQNSVDRPRSS